MNRLLIGGCVVVVAIAALMVQQTSRAQTEAELWAVATEPRDG